jgi:quercetin dioxygenase-like cupin family protein
MKVIRRELLYLAGVAAALPSMSKIAWAQSQVAPKLTQILRKGLEGQGQVVQETIVSVADFGPGTAAPWHMHPGAQELLHVIEGNLVVEVEGGRTTLLKTGEAAIVPRISSISLATRIPTQAPRRWWCTAEPPRINR